MVKIFKAAIGKKNKSWYVENILDLTLFPHPVFRQLVFNDARLIKTLPKNHTFLRSWFTVIKLPGSG